MLPELLALGSRWTFVAGKGGVGKTTTAAALAVALADDGHEVLVLSVDPAHSLGDALGVALGPEPAAVPGVPRLRAMELDASREHRRFLDSSRGALLRLLDRGTYLDRDDIDAFADLTLPGADEVAALLRLMELAPGGPQRVVVDTAPTGHTLRLLSLPDVARGWLAGLDALEERHRRVALGLSGAYRPDEAAALTARLRADLDGLDALLRDAERTRVALVTNAEPVVVAETRRLAAALAARGIAVAGVVVNRAVAGSAAPLLEVPALFVPLLPAEPRGPEGLRAFAAAAGAAPAAASPAGAVAGAVAVGSPFRPPLDRRLYLVAGKGGVGKSTASAALAVRLARGGAGRVLLLGVDPAGSLAEVLGVEVGSEPGAVPGVPGLEARQLEAESLWAAFRRDHRPEAERLLGGLTAGDASAGLDEDVVERLLQLAPPGVDELMALAQVVDLMGDRPYDAVVLDTAPTGHLLRMLELPDVALAWSRAVLRMLLKYREAVGLGRLAERVLGLARDLRALRELLRDPRRTWLLCVALPEALSIPETRRLLSRLRDLGIEPAALLVNRAVAADGSVRAAAEVEALLALGGTPRRAGAPDEPAGPVGPDALADFAERWRELLPSTRE